MVVAEDNRSYIKPDIKAAVIPVQRLTLPKGKLPSCELCGQIATLQSAHDPTFYCSWDHFQLEWDGILKYGWEEITKLNEFCKKELRFLKSPSQSLALQHLQKQVTALCHGTAEYHLAYNNFRLAVPAAKKAIKIFNSMTGPFCSDMVRAHLQLAEAYSGLGEIDKARESVRNAKFEILQNHIEDLEIVSKLQRSLGKLFLATNKFEFAVQSFAKAVYFDVFTCNEEASKIAPTYHLLGLAFHNKAAKQEAFYVFKKVLQLYINCFDVYFNNPKIFPKETEVIKPYLTQVDVAKAHSTIKHILHLAEEEAAQYSALEADANYAMALLWLHCEDYEAAEPAIQQTMKISQRDVTQSTNSSLTRLYETQALHYKETYDKIHQLIHTNEASSNDDTSYSTV